jgi:hypothetical protein
MRAESGVRAQNDQPVVDTKADVVVAVDVVDTEVEIGIRTITKN